MEDLSQAPAAEAPVETPAAPAPEAKPQEVKVVDEKAEEARAEAELNAKLSKVFRESKRERADDGKFASKETKPAAPLDDKPAAKAEPKTPAEKPDVKAKAPEAGKDVKAETPPEKPASKPVQVPQHWPDSVKAKFETLPPDVQHEIAEAGLKDRQAITKIGQAYKALEPTARVLEEFRDTFRAKNLSFDTGIRQLLEAQSILDRDPVAGILAIAKNYGIDLANLSPGNAERSVVHELQQKITQLESKLGERERAERDQKVSGISKTYEEFVAEHPDADDLIDDMVVLLPALQANNPGASYRELLSMAYDKASWANPQARQKRIEAQTKEAEAKALEAARKADEDAKRANSINIEGSPSKNESEDIDALLRRTYRAKNAA